MINSADIRILNKLKIQKILWSGEEYTKQNLAAVTGLSVATCNTLLNEMEKDGIVKGEKKQLQTVGRGTVCYKINEEYESFLGVTFELVDKKRRLEIFLISVTGTIRKKIEKDYEILNDTVICNDIQEILKDQKNITQIIIGTPSIAEYGVIRHCDIPELENIEIVKMLQEQTGIPVCLENDIHLKAYGYYKKYGKEEETVTLLNFPAHVLPGTASVHDGSVIKGKDQFAGMVGFLPYDIERNQQIQLLKKDTCRPFISKAVASLIAIINPSVMVFTGDLLEGESIEWIKTDCGQWIPEEYLPEFFYEENFMEFYTYGMYQKALELKEQQYD